MTKAEYYLDFSDSDYHIFDPLRFEVPSPLLAEVSLRDIQPMQEKGGAYVGVLANLQRTSAGTIAAEWITGYGGHNEIVKQVLNDPSTGLSTIPLEFQTNEGTLEIGGTCVLKPKSGEPTMYLGGIYTVENPQTKTAEIVPPADETKLLLRDITLATAQAVMRLHREKPFHFTTEYSFKSPDQGFTQFGTLTIDDRI